MTNKMNYKPAALFGGIGSIRLLSAFQVASGFTPKGVTKEQAKSVIERMTAINIDHANIPQESLNFTLEKWLAWLADYAVESGQMDWWEPYAWAVPAARDLGWF